MFGKRIISVILPFFLLCGCASGETENTVDVSAAAEALAEVYNGEIVMQDAGKITALLNLEDAPLNAAGGYAEEAPEQFFYIVECGDEESALTVREAMERYLNVLKDSAALYTPDQLELLGNGYTAVKGTYAVIAVCEDGEAVRLKINELFGK